MGILSRFKDIISANINDLLDKCEDPEKMVDQYLRNAMSDLAEVKKETAGVMAQEAAAKRNYDKALNDINKYNDLAKKAIAAGNDGDARTFLAKKQELEAGFVTIQQSYDVAHANADKMRQLYNKLSRDVETLQARRNNVKAQMAVAKTQERINAANDASDKISGTLGSFARMEQAAQDKLDRAAAMAELNDSMTDEVASAEARYSVVNSTSVDDELAALKAEMGLSE
ncbi:MAG: PspA/IM30 family protein [Lachnospiraceae bacterium]|nr:PspA/IM30 family protein [Lachnospiraceae bacterium]